MPEFYHSAADLKTAASIVALQRWCYHPSWTNYYALRDSSAPALSVYRHHLCHAAVLLRRPAGVASGWRKRQPADAHAAASDGYDDGDGVTGARDHAAVCYPARSQRYGYGMVFAHPQPNAVFDLDSVGYADAQPEPAANLDFNRHVHAGAQRHGNRHSYGGGAERYAAAYCGACNNRNSDRNSDFLPLKILDSSSIRPADAAEFGYNSG